MFFGLVSLAETTLSVRWYLLDFGFDPGKHHMLKPAYRRCRRSLRASLAKRSPKKTLQLTWQCLFGVNYLRNHRCQRSPKSSVAAFRSASGSQPAAVGIGSYQHHPLRVFFWGVQPMVFCYTNKTTPKLGGPCSRFALIQKMPSSASFPKKIFWLIVFWESFHGSKVEDFRSAKKNTNCYRLRCCLLRASKS